jgi:hypothetical protein
MNLAIGEFWNASPVRVSVETTGLRGGDAGREGWAEVEIDFLTGDRFDTPEGGHASKVLIKVSGDSEISTLAAALEWAGRQLRELSGAHAVPVSIPPGL